MSNFIWSFILSHQIFFWGFFGGIAAEIVAAPLNRRPLGFWVIQIGMSIVGGFLAFDVYAVSKPILAVHIGASTPLILEAIIPRR